MKIITNQPLIKRNRRIGQFCTFGSLAILAGGLYLSFQSSSQMISFSFLALIVGFLLSQVGIYFSNRWVRSPRPDEMISTALKGLDDKYSLYHYMTPVSHLLVGPAGFWSVLPFTQNGKITYEKNRWRQRGGSAFLRLFAQESLGRPDQEISSSAKDWQRYIVQSLPDQNLPELQAVLVFLNQKAIVEADDAPNPTMSIDKLKDFIRRKAKEDHVTPEQIDLVRDALPQASKE